MDDEDRRHIWDRAAWFADIYIIQRGGFQYSEEFFLSVTRGVADTLTEYIERARAKGDNDTIHALLDHAVDDCYFKVM